jgi:hypothetical protein
VSAPVTARSPRRAPIVLLAIVAIAAGVAGGRARVGSVAKQVVAVDAAQLPPKGALSTAWFCPGLPKKFPNTDQTLTLSNLGSSAAEAIVTIDPEDGSTPVVRTVSVPHDSVRTFARATLAPVTAASTTTAAKPLPDGSLVVEPFSADVVVSAGLETDNALATVPCATEPATDWYFAAGTTVRGVFQWLVLDNPFASDARVDVTLRTDAGLQQLPSLTGLDVPARSRVVVPVHENAVREARVAVQVHASVGRVVASQTLQFTSVAGTPGVATSIGALAPASGWWFTNGVTGAGASEIVAIADVGELDARVNVQAQAAASAIVRPVALTVPSGAVSFVQIGNCATAPKSVAACLAVPPRAGYVLLVQADANAPIVAQTLTRLDGSRNTTLGAATSMGSTVPARQWVIARTHATGEHSTSITLTDTQIEKAHVSVEFVHGGHVDRPSTLAHLTISPGQRFVVPFGAVPALREVDGAVVIVSDVPIFAASTIYAGNDATRAPGIPSR